jgi:transcriptional regulator with XRE-family HTH domain
MSASTEIGFGRRLRMERERRTITLASISDNTKISQSLLESLERDDVSRWPSGIFRRSFIRAYAQAIGLDPDATAKEFLERFPDPAADASPALTDSSAPIASMRLVSSTDPARTSVQTGLKSARGAVVRLTIAGPPTFTSGRILEEVKRRWAAAACDVGVVIAVAVLLFMVVNEFWRPFAVTALGYYVGSIIILGNTPGVSLFAPASGRLSGVSHSLESLLRSPAPLVRALLKTRRRA